MLFIFGYGVKEFNYKQKITMKTKYLLVQWPESQSFIGDKRCYQIQPSLNRAIFVPEEIFNETYNITATSDYINDKLNDIKQIIRQSVSKLLINTSEEQPLYCEIPIETLEAFGISSSLLPYITKIWQDPIEGYIKFNWGGNDDTRDFDCLEVEEMLQILKGLENENSKQL